MAELRSALGQAIRVARARQRLSAAEVARRAGMDAGHWGEIERGERDPVFSTVERIARALDLPLTELVRLAVEERARQSADERS